MPTQFSYPGIYVEEIGSDVRAISAAATSVVAFIGRAARGPVGVAVTIFNFSDFERIFGGLAVSSTMSFAVRDFYLNGGGEAVIVRLFSSVLPQRARLTADTLSLIAIDPGLWGNGLRAIIDYDVAPGLADRFNLTVGTASGAVEVFRNLSLIAGDVHAVDAVLAGQSSLVRVDGALPTIRPAANALPLAHADVWHDNAIATNYSVAVADQATDGDGLTTSESFIPEGARAARIGLYALEQVAGFNLLCIPPCSPDGDIDSALIDAATSYCTERRAMMIIDPPSRWMTVALAEAGLATDVGEPSPNAAIFFPRLLQSNPLKNGRDEPFAPCGAVAGIIVHTDQTRGVWKAAAGIEAALAGVSNLSVEMNDVASARLTSLGINCLRALPRVGPVVWGARTRFGDDQRASEWKYVPVRRLALYIEESVYQGARWTVFEPNDQSLWSSLRLTVAAFMHGLFLQRAFQGLSPAAAFFVKCDSATTTQADIDAGIVNIEVGFAPLRPAEFVVIRVQQGAGQLPPH